MHFVVSVHQGKVPMWAQVKVPEMSVYIYIYTLKSRFDFGGLKQQIPYYKEDDREGLGVGRPASWPKAGQRGPWRGGN